ALLPAGDAGAGCAAVSAQAGRTPAIARATAADTSLDVRLRGPVPAPRPLGRRFASSKIVPDDFVMIFFPLQIGWCMKTTSPPPGSGASAVATMVYRRTELSYINNTGPGSKQASSHIVKSPATSSECGSAAR